MISDRSCLLGFVALLPQFLRHRRRGWHGLGPLLDNHQLSRPAFFLLTALVQETDQGDTLDLPTMQARLFNPYATIFPFVAHLPELVAVGDLAEEANRYAVTPQGRAFALRVEAAAHDYIGTRPSLAADDMAWLVMKLVSVVEALWHAPEPARKLHQARAWRLPPIPTDAPPLAHLDDLVFALWQARDDAHIAAWQLAGFTGPPLDLLSRIWSGEAKDRTTLITLLQATQSPDAIQQGLAWLQQAEYIIDNGTQVLMTERGQQVRTQIETETDRVYFAPWPDWSQADCHRLLALFQQICTALSK